MNQAQLAPFIKFAVAILGFFSIGETAISTVYREGPTVSIWGSSCKSDPLLELNDLSDSNSPESQYIPKNLPIKNTKETYRSLKSSDVYILPEKDKKFFLYRLGCGLECNYKILVQCETEANEISWLVFRDKVSKKNLYYVDKKDFYKAKN